MIVACVIRNSMANCFSFARNTHEDCDNFNTYEHEKSNERSERENERLGERRNTCTTIITLFFSILHNRCFDATGGCCCCYYISLSLSFFSLRFCLEQQQSNDRRSGNFNQNQKLLLINHHMLTLFLLQKYSRVYRMKTLFNESERISIH